MLTEKRIGLYSRPLVDPSTRTKRQLAQSAAKSAVAAFPRSAAMADNLRVACQPNLGLRAGPEVGLPTVARPEVGSPPSRFALWWATFACIQERRLVSPEGIEPSTTD